LSSSRVVGGAGKGVFSATRFSHPPPQNDILYQNRPLLSLACLGIPLPKQSINADAYVTPAIRPACIIS
jgi:hypothetical protein